MALISALLGHKCRTVFTRLSPTMTATAAANTVTITTTTRPMSQWTPNHAEPIQDVDTIDELMKSSASVDELGDLAFKPIKARQSWETCSLFYDNLLHRFIRMAHRKGQKTMMRDLMRETFGVVKSTQLQKYNAATDDDVRSAIELDPLRIFKVAVDNCRPLIITQPVKRGGATYQVPYPLRVNESEDMAMRWLITAVKERPKPRKTFFPENMARELIDAYYNEGKVVKKKQDMHRVCEANRAYAHYRWG
ncbi:28S ribosomal protein S7, mitochondrial-like [Oppia nitens]|uniref:28S ribosomal protein S7, mitochondrial-like n=1 Tax=Oppia nitens TaxID=1686743 RepID=UPI0023DBC28E|nr:28S ribosomal protein S7, mitochondrial-like [Oppia nitens]